MESKEQPFYCKTLAGGYDAIAGACPFSTNDISVLYEHQRNCKFRVYYCTNGDGTFGGDPCRFSGTNMEVLFHMKTCNKCVCPNKCASVGSKGTISEIEEHAKICNWYMCDTRECYLRGTKDEVKAHKEKCRLVRCNFYASCGHEASSLKITEHMEGCYYNPLYVRCRHCHVRMLKSVQTETDHENKCGNEIVICDTCGFGKQRRNRSHDDCAHECSDEELSESYHFSLRLLGETVTNRFIDKGYSIFHNEKHDADIADSENSAEDISNSNRRYYPNINLNGYSVYEKGKYLRIAFNSLVEKLI